MNPVFRKVTPAYLFFLCYRFADFTEVTAVLELSQLPVSQPRVCVVVFSGSCRGNWKTEDVVDGAARQGGKEEDRNGCLWLY